MSDIGSDSQLLTYRAQPFRILMSFARRTNQGLGASGSLCRSLVAQSFHRVCAKHLLATTVNSNLADGSANGGLIFQHYGLPSPHRVDSQVTTKPLAQTNNKQNSRPRAGAHVWTFQPHMYST